MSEKQKTETLVCGFCKQEFPVDAPVRVIIDHLIRSHRKRTLAEFCFMNAFLKRYSDSPITTKKVKPK